MNISRQFFLARKLSQQKGRQLIGQIGCAENLVQSTKVSEGLKPRKEASSTLIMPCSALPYHVFVLFCPVKHWPNPQKTSSARPAHSASSTDLFVFLRQDECIRQISEGSNVKKSRRFTVTS